MKKLVSKVKSRRVVCTQMTRRK